MQTRAPGQIGILRLAQSPQRIWAAKTLILWQVKSCVSLAHNHKISGGLRMGAFRSLTGAKRWLIAMKLRRDAEKDCFSTISESVFINHSVVLPSTNYEQQPAQDYALPSTFMAAVLGSP